ncbi:M16 family metallopeptidase [Paraliomyxa miuraensis]|uniref:M16 family metallopeptidase n=1 Tax=Paraliomyxa miuraensis TaxID=376150 RepID=UPI002252D6BF|nr:pitrilysin family protein [Paraliomyxa miuraensis]MCX4243226.1 insulinase family protein [Paraliomyxa miuraensis]
MAPRTVVVGRGAQVVVLPTGLPVAAGSSGGVARSGRARPGTAGRGAPARAESSAPGGVVALQLWILGGTAAEEREEHGCAHLLEHMLFKPTADGTDLAAMLEGLGGDINAFTSHDETVVHATVPAGHEREAIDVLLGSVLRPALEASSLALETGVVVEEIRQYDDDPASRAMQALGEALYGRHPYARPVLGTTAEVRRHDAARLRRFHRRVYAARRARLVVVGPVDPDAVVEVARPWLEALPRGKPTSEGALAVVEPLSRARVRIRQDDVHEAQIQLGWRGPALPASEACALEVASIVLGYGEASRLTRNVRRGARLVSDVLASFYPSRQGSSLVITAHAEPASVASAVSAILDEVEALARMPLQPPELERALTVLASDLVYRRETAAGHAHALGQHLSLSGSLELDRRYHGALASLTTAEIRRFCARWLRSGAAAVSVVVPKGRPAATSALRAALAKRVKGQGKARPGPVVRVDRHGVMAARLSSGLRVLLAVDRRVPMAAGWLMWPGGLRREDPRRAGTTAMMAKLLTRGCAAIEGDALAREIEGSAAALDGFSGRNSAGLHFECMATSLPLVLQRMVQCAQAPTFAAHELDEERRVALQELDAEQDDPGKLAFRGAFERLYGGHPFRLRRSGTASSLARLRSAGLRKAWAQWYPLGRAVLAISGDVDVDGVVGTLDGLLGADEGPALPPWPGGGPRYPEGPLDLHRPLQREQAHLVLAMPGLAFDDPAAPALDVLLAVLGGQAGRLFVALREVEGLVYHVSASSTEGVDAGDISFYAAAGPDRMPRARQVLEAELTRIRDEPIGDDELWRAKAYLVGQHAIGMERHGRVASLLAFNEAFGLGRHQHLRYRERVERVDARRVRALARRLLDPRRRVVCMVGP